VSVAPAAQHQPTRGMATFVAGLRYEAVPPEVIARMKLLMLDALGCGLYAAPLEWSAILQRSLAAIDTTQGCTVWGTALKLSAPHAALVNGSQVQGFELDDAHRLAILHTGSVVLPALVAITETYPGLSGREFLAAAVAGYEVGPRVGLCMGSAHLAQGWHPAATVGVFAAAAAASRALKLDAGHTMHALGIAGTQSCGLMAAQFGAMVKRMHAGRASQSGVYAALLAASDFTGILDVF
jgi:aconitate decarboxylase